MAARTVIILNGEEAHAGPSAAVGVLLVCVAVSASHSPTECADFGGDFFVGLTEEPSKWYCPDCSAKGFTV